MGKLTTEIFNESCCDGGACSTFHESTRPCGCDPGADHLCAEHKLDFIKESMHYMLKRIDLQTLDGSDIELFKKLSDWSNS